LLAAARLASIFANSPLAPPVPPAPLSGLGAAPNCFGALFFCFSATASYDYDNDNDNDNLMITEII